MLRQHASRRLLAGSVPRCCTRPAPSRLLSTTAPVLRPRHAAPASILSPRATALLLTPPRLRSSVDAAPFSTSPAHLKKQPRGFFDTATSSADEEAKTKEAEEKEAEQQQQQEGEDKESSGDRAKADPAAKATTAKADAAKEADSGAAKSSVEAKSKSASDSADAAADGKASSSSGASSGGSAGGDGSGAGDGGKKGRKSSADKALQKPVVPEVYPQVMAIPIAKRPLFPGFYKAITIKDPNVASAITEMIKRGQPYVGAFLFKDENADDDIIHSADEVHDVGVFAQITSAFPLHGEGATGLTAILYPHRRIRLSTLIPPGTAGSGETSTADVEPVSDAAAPAAVTAEAEAVPEPVPEPEPIPAKPTDEEAQREKKGDVVASFEEGAVTAVPKSEAPAAALHPLHTAQYEPTSFLRKFNVSLVNVENLTEEPFDAKSPVIRAVTNEIVNVFKEVAQMNSLFRDQISTFSMSQSAGHVTAEPAKLADFAAAVSAGEPAELQEVLSSLNVEERMQKALVVLKNELMNAQLQSKITREVESKITKRQREYWLMEQMKGIRRELGIESDGKDKLVEKFKEKADKLAMPEAVRKVFDDEINKLAHLEPAASEFNVTRNYLDWLTQIPWGQRSAENFGIHNAVAVLDEDHYGLKDVKDRILEFIAVGKLRGTVEGKILCFVGPPGVGKTSIGKSIARALNRQYYRFSVGGLTDVAEIKGHRRTYVGALPGRVIQALKKCQTENPLILIDEIDKIGKGYQGDPSSALLELLDPEQNSSFLDHYMDVPVDLSKVLFVCTANMTDTIPRPLLDRMEVIRLSGYVADEKMAIAERYLAPAAKEMAGLQGADVTLSQDAIDELIKSYCRESGVRNLKKQIEKVYRKSALKIVQDLGDDVLPEAAAAEAALSSNMGTDGAAVASVTAADETAASDVASDVTSDDASSTTSSTATTSSESTSATETSEGSAASSSTTTTDKPRQPLNVPESVHVVIDRENLKDYVGPPVFTSDRLYDVTPPGVTMGLAWTQMGGAAMYVETILQSALRPSSRPSLEITGNIKAVMKESSTIAYSFAKAMMVKEFPDNHFFDKAKLHVHVPEGAVQKDGPSAGITMATSLLSLALDHHIDPTIAMTGELTLTGKVLRIGGLREKTIAARRAGCKTIVFPDDNMSDWLELPENIKEGIEGRPVKWYSDVFGIVFKDIDCEQASKCKICEWKKLHEDKDGSKKAENDD
ncbi:ATP-dependent Lon protease pim1 [Sporothrix curviconia]|uniref:Lon protease homolog, mitochondrial n=1 Tax=Sporothrix curviconia TaxID=1260050 RepID=A0ABP0BN67_9PEZI